MTEELDHVPGCDVFRVEVDPCGEPRHCDCGFALWDAKRRGVWTPPPVPKWRPPATDDEVAQALAAGWEPFLEFGDGTRISGSVASEKARTQPPDIPIERHPDLARRAALQEVLSDRAMAWSEGHTAGWNEARGNPSPDHFPFIRFEASGLPYLVCGCGWDDRGDTGWSDHLA